MAVTHDVLLKVAVVGGPGVGKSSLISRFVDDDFQDELDSELQLGFLALKDGTRVKLQIWDVAGSETLQCLTGSNYLNSTGALCVYDVCDKESFYALQEMMQKDGEAFRGRGLVVGNKVDLCSDVEAGEGYYQPRAVPPEMGEALAKSYDMDFQEVSAKEDLMVREAFEQLAEKIRNFKPDIKSSLPEENVCEEELSESETAHSVPEDDASEDFLQGPSSHEENFSETSIAEEYYENDKNTHLDKSSQETIQIDDDQFGEPEKEINSAPLLDEMEQQDLISSSKYQNMQKFALKEENEVLKNLIQNVEKEEKATTDKNISESVENAQELIPQKEVSYRQEEEPDSNNLQGADREDEKFDSINVQNLKGEGEFDINTSKAPDIGEGEIDFNNSKAPDIGEGEFDFNNFIAPDIGEGEFDFNNSKAPDIGEGEFDFNNSKAPDIGEGEFNFNNSKAPDIGQREFDFNNSQAPDRVKEEFDSSNVHVPGRGEGGSDNDNVQAPDIGEGEFDIDSPQAPDRVKEEFDSNNVHFPGKGEGRSDNGNVQAPNIGGEGKFDINNHQAPDGVKEEFDSNNVHVPGRGEGGSDHDNVQGHAASEGRQWQVPPSDESMDTTGTKSNEETHKRPSDELHTDNEEVPSKRLCTEEDGENHNESSSWLKCTIM